jgi:hypothetical protein
LKRFKGPWSYVGGKLRLSVLLEPRIGEAAVELAYDSNLLSRILLSVASIGYGFVTIKADFNATHATNPSWTPHARFHVVWQVLSYSGIATLALGLIWLRGAMETERLYFAAAMAAAVYGAFFISLLMRPLFGGTLYDANGYLPFKVPIGPAAWKWDVNVTVFTVLSVILVLGVILV